MSLSWRGGSCEASGRDGQWGIGVSPTAVLLCPPLCVAGQILSHKLTESSETLVKMKNIQQKCFGHWAIEYLGSSSEASHLASKNSSNKYFADFFMFWGKNKQTSISINKLLLMETTLQENVYPAITEQH